MQAGDICGTNSVAQGKQVCHCEGALRPWQSRSTRSNNRKASGEYGSVTQRGVEDAAPYKACAVDIVHGNLQLPKALTERRYRRNRLVRFCRQPVRIASAPPGAACRSPTIFYRNTQKKLPEAQASGSFSNTINHNQLFTSRRPSSGGRSGAGRPHSPEPSGPRAAACSNR